MIEKDMGSRRIKLNSVCYLVKLERSFNDYNKSLKLQIKNDVTGIKPNYESHNQAGLFTDYFGGEMKKLLAESVANARYFACLIDGSTNSSVTGQVVFLTVV